MPEHCLVGLLEQHDVGNPEAVGSRAAEAAAHTEVRGYDLDSPVKEAMALPKPRPPVHPPARPSAELPYLLS